MKNLIVYNRFSLYGLLLLLCTACDLLNPIFNPQKEFVFPLAVGNKWVYDYKGTGIGTTIWEVTEQKSISNGKYFTIMEKGEGIYNAQPYLYTDTFNITQTSQYVIISGTAFGVSAPPDTIVRFSKDTRDSVKFEQWSTSSRVRCYVNNVGLSFLYADGGSPASGRWSVSLKLRSYTLK